MTTDNSKDDPAGDDLTVIKGIGPARQAWLKEVFAIRSYADLAALSVDRVEAALKDEKRAMVTRSDIQGWLVQAKELAAASGATASNKPSPSSPSEEENADGKAEPAWTPFASFVVEYRCREAEEPANRHQTHIHHIEGDVSETWQGLQGEALGPWMLDHAERLAEPEHEPETAQSDEIDEPDALDVTLPDSADIGVQITEVRIRKPNHAEASSPVGTGQQAFGPIRNMAPFALDADFELIGSDAADLTARAIPYICQFYARDLATGASVHLGDSIPATLITGQLGYRASLYFARLPAGAYRVHVLVIMQTSPPLPGHVDLSVLQVL